MYFETGVPLRWIGRQGGEFLKDGWKLGVERPPVSRMVVHQAAATVRCIFSGCPDQLSLPFALWTKEAVQALLSQRFDLEVSVWTVGRYLRTWGLSPQRPMRRAYEQNPVAVRNWVETEYPAIRKLARQNQAQIYWLDRMLVNSHHLGASARSYGRGRKTPAVFGNGHQYNMISATTNRGGLAFMFFCQCFTARVFRSFLWRLLHVTRKTSGKVFLIADSHPVHKSRSVSRWLAEHVAQIQVFWLPSCSLDLNPD